MGAPKRLESLDIPSFTYNLEINYIYWSSEGIALLLGFIVKMSFTLQLGKDLWITGIPFLRHWFFLIPILMNILLGIWLVFIYFVSDILKRQFKSSIFNYLKHLRFGFFITNFVILFAFYFIYLMLFKPIYIHTGIRLSGHVLSSILSGCIVNNIYYVTRMFMRKNINTDFMRPFQFACLFLMGHNVYSNFWTAVSFHKPYEHFMAYLISIWYCIVIHYLNADRLILELLDFRGVQPNKKIDIIYESRAGDHRD